MSTHKGLFQRFLHALFAFSPTALANYLSQWLGLFGKAGLAHRDFQPEVERLALGVSTVLVLAVYIWLHKSPARILKKLFSFSFIFFIVSLLGCIGLDFALHSMKTKETIELTILIWRWVYFVLLLSTSMSVVSFMLYVLREKS